MTNQDQQRMSSELATFHAIASSYVELAMTLPQTAEVRLLNRQAQKALRDRWHFPALTSHYRGGSDG